MAHARRSEGEPIDRLTRLCDVMTRALEAAPESLSDDKAIILIDNDDEGRGGLVLHGYEADLDAAQHMLGHCKAIFEAHGKPFRVLEVGSG